ncbi:Hpt domain-containing protein, partial [Photobacterium sanctipauli]
HDISVQFLHMYSDEHGNDIAKLTEAIDQQDFDNAVLISHSLKGASGSVCAYKVQQAATVVEKQLKQKQIPPVADIEQLKKMLDAACQQIKQQLAYP